MPTTFERPLLMFTALIALYSPIASVSSYFPVVSRVSRPNQRRLALGVLLYVTIFAQVALWVGEPLLRVLGLTTAALTATGGIALMYAAIPLMRGKVEAEASDDAEAAEKGHSWRQYLLMPATFPLTVGGTTFAIIVSFRAEAKNLGEVVALAVAAVLYALVTALTIYTSGFLERRMKPKTRMLLQRLSGILLTAIAVTLLCNGIPRLVTTTLENEGYVDRPAGKSR